MEPYTLRHRSISQHTLSHMYANTVHTHTVRKKGVKGCGDVLNQGRMTEARGDKGLTAHDSERVCGCESKTDRESEGE